MTIETNCSAPEAAARALEWVMEHHDINVYPGGKHVIAMIAELRALAPQGEPVAWVDVVDTYEGPYNFHGQKFLPKGRSNLYTRPDPRIAQLEADLAAAQAYATTFAVSIHKQHYAEDAPNWQPLPDLVGLPTQIDNMYAGLRNDLEALKVENKRLVGLPLASLRAEREQAIAEVECLWVAIQSHCSAATIKAIESELESK